MTKKNLKEILLDSEKYVNYIPKKGGELANQFSDEIYVKAGGILVGYLAMLALASQVPYIGNVTRGILSIASPILAIYKSGIETGYFDNKL